MQFVVFFCAKQHAKLTKPKAIAFGLLKGAVGKISQPSVTVKKMD